jgi:peptidyl-prolyl cis-trans isomerase B (cyclophilin B)
MVLLETPAGIMKIKLYDSTPQHRDNFLKLVKEGYYDDLLFHRVINNFMIQGGDPESKTAAAGQALGNGGPGYTIDPEFGAFHFKGALAAARQGDQINPQKKSSGSQFYIVQGQRFTVEQLQQMMANKNLKYTVAQLKKYETVGGTPFLDGDYTVFGEVVEGLNVIDQIGAVLCDHNKRPVQDIKMKMSIIK